MQSEKSLDQHQPPLLIGLSGGPAAGKERVCQLIMESLIQRHSLASEKVVMIRYSCTSLLRIVSNTGSRNSKCLIPLAHSFRMEDFFIPVTDATSVNQRTIFYEFAIERKRFIQIFKNRPSGKG
jgi:hypothetical protein